MVEMEKIGRSITFPSCCPHCEMEYPTSLPPSVLVVNLNGKPLHGHPRFYELLTEIADLHSRKNHDYAPETPLENFMECKRFGVPPFKGCLVRISDKWTRIVSLMNKKSLVEDEKIEDTLKDLAVYSLIAIVLKEEETKNE